MSEPDYRMTRCLTVIGCIMKHPSYLLATETGTILTLPLFTAATAAELTKLSETENYLPVTSSLADLLCSRCDLKLTWIFPDSADTDPRPSRGHTHSSRWCTSPKNSFYRRTWTPRTRPCAAPGEASSTVPGMFSRRPRRCGWWSERVGVSHQHHPWWAKCLLERLQSRMRQVWLHTCRKTVIRRCQNMLRGSVGR